MTTDNNNKEEVTMKDMTTDSNEEVTMKDAMDNTDDSTVYIHSGDVVQGTVLSVNEEEVVVNIGFMTDGVIPKEEISNEKDINPTDIVKIGDEISVYIMKINNGEGNVLLSKKRADGLKVWDKFQEILDANETLEITIGDIVKGGATTYIEGVRAFIPASQMSDAYIENLQEFKGRTLVVKIIELDKENKNIVLSRRVIEKEENQVKRDIILE